jgi:hypothetical protein
MSNRIRFPPRRGSVTFGVRYADVEGLRLKAFLTYSRDNDGKIREVFVNAGKPGSPNEAALRDAGLLISLLLQHGLGIHDVKAAVTRGPDDRPASQIGVVVDALAAEELP